MIIDTNLIVRKIIVVNERLAFIYGTAQICKIENFKRKCYNGESDVTKLMATSRFQYISNIYYQNY